MKKKKKIITIVIVVILLLAVAGGVFVIIDVFGKPKNDDVTNNDTNKNEDTEEWVSMKDILKNEEGDLYMTMTKPIDENTDFPSDVLKYYRNENILINADYVNGRLNDTRFTKMHFIPHPYETAPQIKRIKFIFVPTRDAKIRVEFDLSKYGRYVVIADELELKAGEPYEYIADYTRADVRCSDINFAITLGLQSTHKSGAENDIEYYNTDLGISIIGFDIEYRKE